MMMLIIDFKFLLLMPLVYLSVAVLLFNASFPVFKVAFNYQMILYSFHVESEGLKFSVTHN